MKLRILFFVAAGLLLPVSIFAQPASAPSAVTTSVDPMVAYRAYEAAITAENLDEAATQAQIAWQAAEVKWGASNANTASLAYNAAWSAALTNKPEIGTAPAARAVELVNVAGGTYLIDDAKFLLAYNRYFSASRQMRNSLANELASSATKVAQTWEDVLIITALNAASSKFIELDRPRQARDTAVSALAQLERLEINSPSLKAAIMFNRGRAHLYLRNHREAVSDLIDSRIAYGEPKTEDDLTWGRLAAWSYAAEALALSDGYVRHSETGTHIARNGNNSRIIRRATVAEYEQIYGNGDLCRREEFIRDPNFGHNITFPPEQRERGIVAGVLVKLTFDDSGQVTAAKIIGAVPTEAFGANATRAMLEWRYNIPADAPKECKKSFLVPVIFSYN